MIRTVLGDIRKEMLGETLAHEHLIVDLSKVRKDNESLIKTIDEVIPEISMAMEDGIRSVFEVTTIDMFRDVEKLKRISEITGLQIVCSTGYYLQAYHPDWMKEATPEEICRIYVRELTEEIEDTGIRAGLIAEIASGSKGFTEEEKKCLIAAGKASALTGAAVSTHTGRVTAMETVETLLAEGMDPDKIIIGHQDLINDTDYHVELLKMGVNIGFDTCGKAAYMPDETRAANIRYLIEKGYGDHIVLSNDISRRSYFCNAGNHGYTAVTRIVVPLLREIGVTEKDIHRLLIDNPARIADNGRWE